MASPFGYRRANRRPIPPFGEAWPTCRIAMRSARQVLPGIYDRDNMG